VKYDPRNHGARCGECPLGPGSSGVLRKDLWQPVPPERHTGARVLAVGESPSAESTTYGRPLVGRAGSEWNSALSALGKRRPDVDLDHVTCCKPSGQEAGAWRRFDKDLGRLNKKRAKDGDEAIAHPSECCRPRLLSVAANYPYIITMGKRATFALTRLNSSIQATRGGPLSLDDDWSVVREEGTRKAMPMLSPGFIQRSPSWRHVLHADLGKAFRWFADTLRWEDPDVLWKPEPHELEEWLAQPSPFWVYDVETDGIEAMTCGLRTIAIAIPDLDANGKVVRTGKAHQVSRAVAFPILSTDGHTRLNPPEKERALLDIMRRVFTDGRVWVGHNAGSYDRMVVEHHLGVTPKPLVDTLFPARFRAPDLPKGLKTIGSILTDVERWETTEKGTKISTGSQDDDELLRYNILDTVVNARIVAPLIDAAAAQGAFRGIRADIKPGNWPGTQAWNLNEVDHKTQEMCVEMHKNGVWVDQGLRGRLEVEYKISVDKRYKNLRALAPTIDNPGSAAQIRDLLYDKWQLSMPAQMETKDFYTEAGLPSTGDAVLRGHLAGGQLNPEQTRFIYELRLYRREKNKVLGTTLIPMRTKRMDPKKGVAWDDGRVRSSWNAHVTSVGRLSSSGPNLQNLGSRKGQGRLKSIFAAPPGRILIGADLDQAHLRITASYWKIPLLLECFREGKDPHNTLAASAFGDRFANADGWGPDGFSLYTKPSGGTAKAMRDVVKTLRYSSIYAANPATVWQIITSTEVDNGELPYVGMSIREVRVMHDAWLKSEPEWAQAWDRMMADYKHQGWMEEPVMGRRSGPLSDGKLNEVVNFPILAAEGSVMRLAECAVRDAFPFEFAGPGTGMIHQCHDSIAVEVPLPGGFDPLWSPVKGEPLPPEIERMRRTMEECMVIRIPSWEVPMTAEADVGRTLKDI